MHTGTLKEFDVGKWNKVYINDECDLIVYKKVCYDTRPDEFVYKILELTYITKATYDLIAEGSINTNGNIELIKFAELKFPDMQFIQQISVALARLSRDLKGKEHENRN